MDYDVVIPTKNRAEALKLSIPLILEQVPPPKILIVVDASREQIHDQIIEVAKKAAENTSVVIKVLSSKANSALQRNVGLGYVESPVVIFGEDDCLWWAGYAKAIMHIYEEDKNGDIGGVCGRETPNTPPGTNITTKGPYKMTISDRIRQKIGEFRHKFDYKFCPDPLWIHGRSRWNVRPFPEWLWNIDSALVEFMGGGRSSFRTEVIRKYGFDKELGVYTGYAAYEDADASFKVLQEQLLVGAHDAHICHYRAPSRRAKGFQLGFILLFNRAYIICKYSPPGSKARRMLKRFGRYKLALYSTAIFDSFGRDRVRGTLVALKSMDELLNCPAEGLRGKYLGICDREMNRNSPDNNE
ncbi:glycosyltransferase [Planctomycetota bacterium]